jgi:predicted flap endonuclease-1-like 5' DNA nuclease
MPKNDLPPAIGKPALNALHSANITTLQQIATLTDKELLALHGVGPKAVRILKEHSSKLRAE